MGHYRIRPQHELFLREYIKNGGNGAAAYRVVYPHIKPNCDRASAGRLMARSDIRNRYEILLERHMRRVDITIEKILGDYQDALDVAREQNKAGDMVNAATAQAKLVGLLRDRVEAGGVGDFENVADVSEILEIVQREAGPDAALALAKAFNINQPPEVDQSVLADAKPPSDAVN